MRSATPRPRSCSSSVRAPLTRPSHRVRRTRAPSPVSAGTSMGFRSRSSWRPPAVAVLSPQQIEARLQDRFRLLSGGARTPVARHRTLEAAVDWSYELLSEPERELLRRLSVFHGGWTLGAAEQVCASDGVDLNDVFDLLSRLVDKSLVVVDSDGGRRASVPLSRDSPPVCAPTPRASRRAGQASRAAFRILPH